MSHRWVRDISSLYDFIGYVVVSAPDRFPHEDYLAEADQMNLTKAFVELSHGVELVIADEPSPSRRQELQAVLAESLAFYRAGNDVLGAHRVQDFQNLIFKE